MRISDWSSDVCSSDLLRYYDAHIAVHSRPFPGLTAALDRLDALGVRTAVATNKAEDMARKLLGELGLAGRMAAIIGGDTQGPGERKPHRSVENTSELQTLKSDSYDDFC